jgi:hypothetical protein
MPTDTVTVAELIDRLSPEGLQRMNEAMLPEVLDAVAEQARADAPQKRGYSSAKSIVSRIKPIVIRTGVWGVVRAGAPHSHWFEFGVKAHSLRPGSGRKKKRRGSSGVMKIWGRDDLLRRDAQHPGFGARPFLGPAPDKAHGEIDAIMEDSGEALFTNVRRWKRRTKRAKRSK